MFKFIHAMEAKMTRGPPELELTLWGFSVSRKLFNHLDLSYSIIHIQLWKLVGWKIGTGVTLGIQ